MNILITSASRKVSLVQSFKEALKKEGGGNVIAADASPFSASFFFADKHYLLPYDSDIKFLDNVIAICKKENVKLLIPTRDEELRIFSQQRRMFEEIGVQIAVASERTIEVCQDKLKFFEFCKKNSITVPKIYDLKKDILQFPLFLNGRVSKAGKNAFKVHTKEELNLFSKIAQQPFVQEYIDAREYTVDLFADFDGNIISVVPRERIKVFGGESFVSKTFNNKKIIAESVVLARKLNLVGHNTIQCFFDGKTVTFFEVNPRFGGAASLSFAAGANTPHFLVKIARGKTIKPQIGACKDGLVMLRYTDDFFINEQKLRGKK